jgi:hypothetical protein
MSGARTKSARIALEIIGLIAWGASWAEAGLWPRRRAAGQLPPPAVPVPAAFDASAYPMRGSFYPSPYLMVRGNWPAGGGYSPLGIYGDASMAVYGPLSPLRSYTAPVVTYQRGYDGRVIAVEGTSFSTPNRPELTPIVYPTQSSYYYRIRETGDPPWWANGMDWIDQN